jgi:hypothetical protein
MPVSSSCPSRPACSPTGDATVHAGPAASDRCAWGLGETPPTPVAILDNTFRTAAVSDTTATCNLFLLRNNDEASSRAGHGASIPAATGDIAMGVPGACLKSSANRLRVRSAETCQVTTLWTVAGTSTGLSTGLGARPKLLTFARLAKGVSRTGSCGRQVRAASRQTRFIHTIGRALLRPPSTYMNFSKKTVDSPTSKKTLSATAVRTPPGSTTLASPAGPDRSPSPWSPCEPTTSGDIS